MLNLNRNFAKNFKLYGLILLVFTFALFYFLNDNNMSAEKDTKNKLKEAYFAGGCFWCMEGIFQAQEWVKEAVAWYIWWDKQTAHYDIVSTWDTKHREAIKVLYDPEKISYKELLELFWMQIDPTDEWGQFADRGYQYTSAIYYSDAEEKLIAEESKRYLEDSGKFDNPIATLLLPESDFFEAEDYHQDYYLKNPTRYKLYSRWSGRDDYKQEVWSGYSFGEDR